MKEEKGFTLVEVLAIIAVLGVMVILTFPSIGGSNDTKKEKELEKIIRIIENSVWNLGGQTYSAAIPASTMYASERSNTSSKLCTATTTYNNQYLCTDTVNRTTKWTGKIGLIYPSDYGYSSTDASCASDIYGSDSTCKNNNWLHGNGNYITMTPFSEIYRSSLMWTVSANYITVIFSADAYSVRPSFYLSSNVQIIGGDGNTTPFKLAI